MATAGLPPQVNNASASFDFAAWTASQLKSAANLSQYAPSASDLLWAGPRMGMKIGSFIFALPSVFDDVLAGRVGQRVIPEATTLGRAGAITTTITAVAQDMAHAGAALVEETTDPEGVTSRLSIESGRSFGNIVAYATSRWSLSCIIMAVVLNRTHIYASTRRNLTLGFRTRFFLRIMPIILFILQARWLLQSIQCQSSPEFGLLRWGNASKTSDLMFTQNGGALHTISSTLLFGASDAESCRAVKMIPPLDAEGHDEPSSDGLVNIRGSLSRLWPLFQTLCFSHFVETLSCAVQGRHVAAETGMTLFEHSLAFAEADAAVSSALGFGPFGGTSSTGQFDGPPSGKMADIAISRAMIMKRINTSPEVLLIGFLSSMSHITSHVLGIFNLQSRYRLLSTGFWGLCFMSTITWSIMNFSVEDLANQSLLRFPTVCIIGFIPHVLILAGIVLCAVIYGFAVVLTALSPPSTLQIPNRSFMQKLALAHENMQANVPLSNIRITMHMDFYTALLKTGFSALTMASEAVYLNESSEVNIRQRTWLEDERFREIDESGAQWLGSSAGTMDDCGLVIAKAQGQSASGYSRERTAQKSGKVKSTDKVIRDGIGATERSGRWITAFEYIFGIVKLIVSWFAVLMLKVLSSAGLRLKPRWLLWLAKKQKGAHKADVQERDSESDTLDFWLLNNEGNLVLPVDDHVDVEDEMRKRLKGDSSSWSNDDEQKLDSSLYGWWLGGGWWGGDDSSGYFIPKEHEIEDDNTSLVSISDLSSVGDWESQSDDDNNDGRRTPTQNAPYGSREATPIVDTPLSSADLAQLLHPKTPEQREQATTLAAHLASDTIMTRSRYRDLTQREKSKVLTSTRQRPQGLRKSSKLTIEEESQLLEYLIIARRTQNSTLSPGTPSPWAQDATGTGEGGPQCVVCQSAPRSIIVWPCRCLSLCDDCRVTLAMNNFDKCVCCRRDVGSFSRIFVP